jgi:hypothetical protein
VNFKMKIIIRNRIHLLYFLMFSTLKENILQFLFDNSDNDNILERYSYSTSKDFDIDLTD